jgi:hypothetical protein
MPEAWIQLSCPACESHWEANPVDLPPSDQDFECQHCQTTRPVAEFMRTQRDLEILKQFHER